MDNKHSERFFKSLNFTITFVVVMYLLIYLFGPLYWLNPADSTDFPNKRSGFALMIDAKTGCHYLRAGGLTPRLDAQGKHICTGVET